MRHFQRLYEVNLALDTQLRMGHERVTNEEREVWQVMVENQEMNQEIMQAIRTPLANVEEQEYWLEDLITRQQQLIRIADQLPILNQRMGTFEGQQQSFQTPLNVLQNVWNTFRPNQRMITPQVKNVIMIFQ